MARKIATNILFDHEQLDKIDVAADRARLSRSAWVRRAVEVVLAGQVTLDLEPAEETPA